MAKKNPTLVEALTQDKKIGSYTESTGGGTPLEKGEKLKDHPEAKRVQQPRDENGQFTYNSVNAIPLKYGPSRGTTIPPFLRGVTLTYCQKSTKSVVLNGKVFYTPSFKNAEDLINAFKEYKDEKDQDGNVIGFGDKMNARLKGKRGARTSAEKQAIAGGEKAMIGGESYKTPTGPARRGDIQSFMSNFSTFKKKFKVGKNKFAVKQTTTTSTPTQSRPTPTPTPAPSRPTTGSSTPASQSNNLHNVSSGYNAQNNSGSGKSGVTSALVNKLKSFVTKKPDNSPTRQAKGKDLSKDEIDDLFK